MPPTAATRPNSASCSCLAAREQPTYSKARKSAPRCSLKEPGGVFTLPERPLDFTVVMICTGTGVAPFRAMLQERLPKEENDFHLIFGCRKFEDILYREEFEALAEKYPKFRYTVCMSREDPAEDLSLEAHRGYVHQVYQELYADVKADIRFYLCGWSQMVDEAKAKLLEMGYEEQQIILELYG
jgi:sulfite reductase alpha subunit-like flavoprotein